jgi:hypothetical protein
MHRGVASIVALVALGSCGFVTLNADLAPIGAGGDVASVSGWSRLQTSSKYIAVANVLPGEAMVTAEENRAHHPLDGELIIAGPGAPEGANVRHVEVHIYDRVNGLPMEGLHLVLEVINLTSGEHFSVPATEMQDLHIGPLDLHYGNNIPIVGPADVRVIVTIGDERMTFDGHLD